MKVTQSRLIKKNKQRGDILIEALIGMLLLAIIGLGLVYIISRVSVSQKDMNLHNLVVSTLREKLQAGECIESSFKLVEDGETFSITPHSQAAPTIEISSSDASLPKKSVTLEPLCSLSVSHSSLGGTICVGPIPCE